MVRVFSPLFSFYLPLETGMKLTQVQVKYRQWVANAESANQPLSWNLAYEQQQGKLQGEQARQYSSWYTYKYCFLLFQLFLLDPCTGSIPLARLCFLWNFFGAAFQTLSWLIIFLNSHKMQICCRVSANQSDQEELRAVLPRPCQQTQRVAMASATCAPQRLNHNISGEGLLPCAWGSIPLGLPHTCQNCPFDFSRG